jgi:hypothetical protein
LFDVALTTEQADGLFELGCVGGGCHGRR